MGELVIIQTLVKFIRADQGWCPRGGICVKGKINCTLMGMKTKLGATGNKPKRLLIKAMLMKPWLGGETEEVRTYGLEAST